MKKVLIADDSMVASRQLAEIIRQLDGFELVGRASNGAEVLALCQELEPDIVCMDMVMPVMDGLQALRSLSMRSKHIRVIMVTSLGVVGQRVTEAVKLGACAVLAKPFSIEQVHGALKAVDTP